MATSNDIKNGTVIKEGDQVKVKVLGFDDRGKVKLSMRVVDQATGADITDQVGAKRPRPEGEDRGERRDRGDRGPRRDRGDRPERGERSERAEREPAVDAAPGGDEPPARDE